MIVAGGGTGGHLFPGIAVAQAFMARYPNSQVMFFNAGRPLEIEVLTRLGWPWQSIPIEGIKGRGFWQQLTAALKIPRAIWLSGRKIRQYKAHAVLGVGGYSAGPVVVAAWLQGVPTALHEQNQLPGMTNRLLRRIVDRIYLTFTDDCARFDPAKTLVTGNPVRDEIVVLGDQALPKPEGAAFTVLVVGGSQGAQAINQAMLEAVPSLKVIPGLRIVHQTGLQDETLVQQAYARAGLTAEVRAFFNDMAGQYQQADLIVCRAGATTVAEITAIGKAAVFVPFPFAADDHQTHNAQALVEAGAAEMIAQKDLNGQLLADRIIDHAQNRRRLAEMAANARSLGRPEAALRIVNDLLELIKRETGNVEMMK